MAFQASTTTYDQSPLSYDGAFDNAAFAVMQNNYRPRPSSRPLCTHCGQLGHVIQKCFKLHGYPPGYIPGYKSNYNNSQSSQRPHAPYSQPRGQTPVTRPPTQAIANAVTSPSLQYPTSQNQTIANAVSSSSLQYPTPPNPVVSAVNLDVSQLSNDQVQSLLQHYQAHVKASEPPAPTPQLSSITEHGIMAAQSSSGTTSSSYLFPSSSLRYENSKLTFQHQCLSSLSTNLPHGSWIIDSGATSHVCSDLALFHETMPVSGVTVTLPNDTRVSITHCGTVQLSSSLVLHDVLHVPSFKFNLISVSCLLKHN